MRSRGSSHRLSAGGSGGLAFGSRVSALLLAMFSTMATIYVAGRLWQDAESRLHLVKELEKRNGQVQSAISVDETLKIIDCREQHKKLSAVQNDLAAARQAGFVSKLTAKKEDDNSKKKLLAVIGIITTFGREKNRDAIRKAWMPRGADLKKLENEKGIVVRFVIGRSANRGGSLDREIDGENRQTNDFIILDGQMEATEDNPKKTKLFLIHAVENWNAEFYVKVNDDVYVNIDALGAILSTHLDKPRVYIGCMKSGEVFSEPHMVSISGPILYFSDIFQTYTHDDVSTGSWFIGLDVKHINEWKFCCSSWSTGAICAAV